MKYIEIYTAALYGCWMDFNLFHPGLFHICTADFRAGNVNLFLPGLFLIGVYLFRGSGRGLEPGSRCFLSFLFLSFPFETRFS